MQGVAQKVSAKYQKKSVVDVKSGDTVKVHQRVKEGNKTRIQIFEGLVIRVGKKQSLTSTFTVRRIASGVGVEKSYLIHSPNVVKVEVVKRSKVRRNYLSYMRELTGKSARLTGVEFDKTAVNAQGEIAEEEKPSSNESEPAEPAEPTEQKETKKEDSSNEPSVESPEPAEPEAQAEPQPEAESK